MTWAAALQMVFGPRALWAKARSSTRDSACTSCQTRVADWMKSLLGAPEGGMVAFGGSTALPTYHRQRGGP